jgi:nucleoside-diphosphate-sugar epimerase
MKILLTGFTGNLGPAIAQSLASHSIRAVVRDMEAVPFLNHVELLLGDLDHLPESITADTEIIVHSAASTAFRAPLDELRLVNVRGTQLVLDFAARCPRLRKFVHLSTACVCGADGGDIPEAPLPRPSAFVNAYERSKWEAEQLIFASDLPVEIVRLAIVAGSEHDGSVRRMGALHHTLFWLWKGLIPMMPGAADTPVDLISTEFAAAVVAECVEAPLVQHRVLHGCAGAAAPGLGELLAHLAQLFSKRSSAWAAGHVVPPALVDAETFAMFETSVLQSGDVLFRRVCEDSKSFLPSLLHPRRYLSAQADVLCHATRPDWKNLAELVTHHVVSSRS